LTIFRILKFFRILPIFYGIFGILRMLTEYIGISGFFGILGFLGILRSF
jgi:hypothetical protein